MGLQSLRHNTIGSLLDGAVGRMIDAEFDSVELDLKNRPKLDTPRKIVITVQFEPTGNDEPGMGGANVSVSAKSVLPPRKAPAVNVMSTRSGELKFRADSPEDARQSTISDVLEADDDNG